MDSLAQNIALGLILVLFPVILYNYKNIRNNKKQIILWGILSFMISILYFKLAKIQVHYIELLITVILSSIINYFIINGGIDLKKLSKSGLVLFLFFFISLVQLIPIEIFNLDINNLSDQESIYLTTFSDIVLLIILGIIYFKTIKDDFLVAVKSFYKQIDIGVKYWLLGLIVMVVSNLIIGLFIPQAQATNEEGVQSLITAAPLLSILTVGILAPIIEELTFRKAFRDVFKNKTLFILVSGLVFGSLHVVTLLNSYWDLFYIIPYSSLGIAFGYIYTKTDNIYTSIFMHVFHNTALTIISVIGAMMII